MIDVDEILAVLPEGRIKPYDFLITYDGVLYDVKSINKQRKTATLITDAGDMKVNLSEIDSIKSHEEYMSE